MDSISSLDIPSKVKSSTPGVMLPGLDLMLLYASKSVLGSVINL